MDRTEKILLVDDEPFNVKLLRAILATQPYHTLSASSGEEALQKVEEEPPDLILLDIMMPGLDGYEVTKRLKRDPGTRDIPIILVTALDGPGNKIKGLEAGADEFLNKPVDKAEILARVKSLLRLKRYQDQLKTRVHSETRIAFPSGQEKFTNGETSLPAVLLVEDNKNDSHLLQVQLYGQPYEIKCVRNGEEALSLVHQEKIDLVLLDLLLPGMDGFAVTKELKESDETKNIQIVAITALQDLESRIRGIELGVDDYLVKPINMHELKVRVNALIKKKAYLDKLCSGYRSAVRSAITDKLTGLYNYAYFTLFLENEIKRAIRHDHALALIMLDLDDFKHHNDDLGHLAGDQILKEFGHLVCDNVREIDLCFRYGGEEFVIVLPYTGSDPARGIAERLREIIADHPFLSSDPAGSRRITASMGIASYPSHAASVEDLIRKADEALYEAKRKGKNCVCASSGFRSGKGVPIVRSDRKSEPKSSSSA
jgi:two-component system cell cycle response regulator